MNSERLKQLMNDVRLLATRYDITLKQLADAVNAIAYAEMFKEAKEHKFEEGTLKLNKENDNG